MAIALTGCIVLLFSTIAFLVLSRLSILVAFLVVAIFGGVAMAASLGAVDATDLQVGIGIAVEMATVALLVLWKGAQVGKKARRTDTT